MSRIRPFPFAVFAVIAAAGCASRMYSDRVPTGDNLIDIEFVNASPKPQVVRVFEDDFDCYDPTLVTLFDGLTNQHVKAKYRPYYSVYMYYQITATVLPYSWSSSCEGTFTFPMLPDTDYRVSTQVDPSQKGCSFYVQGKARTSDADWTSVSFEKRIGRAPMVSNGPFCASETKYRGSSVLPQPRG